MDKYRGWSISFSNQRPLEKVYVAWLSKDVVNLLYGPSRVAIERAVDAAIQSGQKVVK